MGHNMLHFAKKSHWISETKYISMVEQTIGTLGGQVQFLFLFFFPIAAL